MPSSERYKPRLSIEITAEQQDALNRHLGNVHGLKVAFFRCIVEDVIDVLEGPNKKAFISAILHRQLGVEDFVKQENGNG